MATGDANLSKKAALWTRSQTKREYVSLDSISFACNTVTERLFSTMYSDLQI